MGSPDLSIEAEQLGAATLHEAAGRTGALPSLIKPVDASWRIAGPAFTVASPPGDNLWIHRAIARAAPGDVLVVATGASREFGYWGEVMSRAAIARRLGALVIDGGVRDGDALRSLGFPVFASGLCIRGTVKDPNGVGSIGSPITIGDVTVRPGDLVVGDGDGVVVIDASSAGDVVQAGHARVAKELEVFTQLKAGRTTLEIYDLDAG